MTIRCCFSSVPDIIRIHGHSLEVPRTTAFGKPGPWSKVPTQIPMRIDAPFAKKAMNLLGANVPFESIHSLRPIVRGIRHNPVRNAGTEVPTLYPASPTGISAVHTAKVEDLLGANHSPKAICLDGTILTKGSPSPTTYSRSSPQPCLERRNRGPNALPSFSHRGLRGSYHEGRGPSGCEPVPSRMESARMMWVLADPYHQGIVAHSYEDQGHTYLSACHTQAIYSFFQPLRNIWESRPRPIMPRIPTRDVRSLPAYGAKASFTERRAEIRGTRFQGYMRLSTEDLHDPGAQSEVPNGRTRLGLPYYCRIRSFIAESGKPNLTPPFC